jgi:hypothetical protein
MGQAGRAIRIVIAAAWILAIQAGTASASPHTDLEYSVKANYLVRFAAFVEWPASAFADGQTPVSICVLGRDPFGPALERAARDQTARSRALAVRRPATLEAAAGCHILYLGRGAPAIEARRGLLVVTDAAVSDRRGMIHFVISDARVRFHIDLQSASRERLSISSRLLNLALSVQGG